MTEYLKLEHYKVGYRRIRRLMRIMVQIYTTELTNLLGIIIQVVHTRVLRIKYPKICIIYITRK